MTSTIATVMDWDRLSGLATMTANKVVGALVLPAGRSLQVYANPVDPIPAILVVERLKAEHGVLCSLTPHIGDADIFVDIHENNLDLWYEQWIAKRWSKEDLMLFPEGKEWFPLFSLTDGTFDGKTILPYEQRSPVVAMLKAIGDDPNRDGLLETPARVEKSWKHLFSGYEKNPADCLKEFESSYDEMVVLRDIEMYSTCEHHMQPFFGKAHIAYLPNEKVVGISKLARVLEIYARRLQIQERICQQVTDALMEHLKPKGAACVIEAKHFCMMCRGVEKQNSTMMTSSLKGAFRDAAVRAEFFSLIKG